APWLPLAIAPPAELPWVHPHPVEREWLLADGGLWRVDDRGEVSLLLGGQVRQGIYAADPSQMVALVEPEAPGELGPGIEVWAGPPERLAPLFTHPWLRTGMLVVTEPPAGDGFRADRDADGIADDADRCPDAPELILPGIPLPNASSLSLAEHDGTFLLARVLLSPVETRANVEVRDRDGTLISQIDGLPAPNAINGSAMPAIWYRDHFEVWIPVNGGPQQRVVLTPDHQLPPGGPILVDLVDPIQRLAVHRPPPLADDVLYGASADYVRRLDGLPLHSVQFRDRPYMLGLEAFGDELFAFVRRGFQRISLPDMAISPDEGPWGPAPGGWSTATSPQAIGIVGARDNNGQTDSAFMLIDANGPRVTAAGAFNDMRLSLLRVALAWGPGRWGTASVVAGDKVQFRDLTADGQGLGPKVAIGRDAFFNDCGGHPCIAIAWLGDRYVAAWRGRGSTQLRIGRFDCEGPPDE
ncbi:MAG: hypothetical protein KC620_16910, partial [Myxococcales bacterium]|nr:hypothetical protein [Myxococcales bacterium]